MRERGFDYPEGGIRVTHCGGMFFKDGGDSTTMGYYNFPAREN